MANVNADVMWNLVSALKDMLGKEVSDGTEQALVTRVERDGTVYVRLLGADAETPVNGERLSDVDAGDVVTVSVANGLLSIIGNSTKPSTNAEHVSKVVEPVAERADNAVKRASEASAKAVDAEKVANATAQHVWADDSGLHVTEVEQEEWNDPTSEGYHGGMNVLLNALGQLFRIGLNNLLSMASGTDPAIEIYDGEGNGTENVVAKFAKNLIELGKGSTSAVIKLCGGLGKIWYDRNENDGTLKISNSGGGEGTALRAGDGETSASVGVQPNEAYMFGSEMVFRGDYVTLIDFDDTYGEYQMPVSDVLSVITNVPVNLYDNASASASAAATLSESAANFRHMTIFFKDTDNNCSSVDVWNPNGKRVSLGLTWINGASTQEMYQRVRWVTISGTTISTAKDSSDVKYRTGQVKLGATASVENNDYIAITHVIGYR